MCVINEGLYLFRIPTLESYGLNKVHTQIGCVTYEWYIKQDACEKNVDEISVSRATEMADLSRHFKWKYS